MYAVIKVAGNQYRVTQGDHIRVEHLPAEVGDKLELSDVLMVASGDKMEVGKPIVSNASVKTTVIEQGKGKKVLVFHYRPGGKRHRVKASHRQQYTWLRVDEISTD